MDLNTAVSKHPWRVFIFPPAPAFLHNWPGTIKTALGLLQELFVRDLALARIANNVVSL
jgi:hypothetical protein